MKLAVPDGWLEYCGWRKATPPSVVLFVAHPDDETLMMGGRLRDLPRTTIIHATDGAPRNLRDAHSHGFPDTAAYAAARRQELSGVLQLAGLPESACECLGFADQEAAHNLVALTRAFAARIAELRPDIVVTHAYEGGHPDHDAVAFAAHSALRSIAATALLIEAPSYHSYGGAFVRQSFAEPAPGAVTLPLDAAARDLKRRMLDCFVTQRETLTSFHVETESFRHAPAYDFIQPANGGDVLYDRYDWNCESALFGERVRAALHELRLPACP